MLHRAHICFAVLTSIKYGGYWLKLPILFQLPVYLITMICLVGYRQQRRAAGYLRVDLSHPFSQCALTVHQAHACSALLTSIDATIHSNWWMDAYINFHYCSHRLIVSRWLVYLVDATMVLIFDLWSSPHQSFPFAAVWLSPPSSSSVNNNQSNGCSVSSGSGSVRSEGKVMKGLKLRSAWFWFRAIGGGGDRISV